MKIAIIGGGSYTWTFGFARDILGTARAGETELCLMDINPQTLAFMATAVTKLVRDRASSLRVTTATDLPAALTGADMVLISIAVGGLAAMASDLAIPERFGIRHTVGDTVGPGGWSRAVRNVPVFHDIAAAVKAACPDAWVLNFSNPMSVLTRVPHRYFGLKTIGMCPGVDATAETLCRIAGGDPDQNPPDFVNTGIDHGSWFTSLHCGAIDVPAALKERGFCTASGTLPASVTVDAPHIGAMPAGLAVFAALARAGLPALDQRPPRGRELALGPRRRPGRGALRHQADFDRRPPQGLRPARAVAARLPRREAPRKGSGRPRRRAPREAHRRLRRRPGGDLHSQLGQVPGFPADAVMETRCRFDAAGVHPLVSPMPDILKIMVLPHVLRQELVTGIALHGTFDELVALVTTDPLCAHLDLGRCREMVKLMLAANRDLVRNPRLLAF